MRQANSSPPICSNRPVEIVELVKGTDEKRRAVFDPNFVPYLGQAIGALHPPARCWTT